MYVCMYVCMYNKERLTETTSEDDVINASIWTASTWCGSSRDQSLREKMFCLYSFGIHTHHCNHEDKQSGLYGETFLRRGKIRALNNEGSVGSIIVTVLHNYTTPDCESATT